MKTEQTALIAQIEQLLQDVSRQKA